MIALALIVQNVPPPPPSDLGSLSPAPAYAAACTITSGTGDATGFTLTVSRRGAGSIATLASGNRAILPSGRYKSLSAPMRRRGGNGAGPHFIETFTLADRQGRHTVTLRIDGQRVEEGWARLWPAGKPFSTAFMQEAGRIACEPLKDYKL